MKKLLLTCWALWGATLLFAVDQYTVTPTGIGINQNLSMTVHVSGNNLFKGYDQFGFYVQNSDGTYRNQSFSIAEAQHNGKKFDFGDFTAGKEVKFYIARDGQVFENFSLENKNTELVNLAFYKPDGKLQDTFKIHFDSEAVSVGDTPDAPDGQPLPGVIAVLAIGTIGLCGAGRFHKKKKQI